MTLKEFAESFMRGIGSVLEFFPPPDRLDSWQIGRDAASREWSAAYQSLLARLQAEAKPSVMTDRSRLN